MQSNYAFSYLELQVTVLAKGLQKDLYLRADLEPVDFLEEICLAMYVRRDTAQLGYKLPYEKQGDPPHGLKTPEDAEGAISAMRRAVARARTRDPILKIVNLVGAEPFGVIPIANYSTLIGGIRIDWEEEECNNGDGGSIFCCRS